MTDKQKEAIERLHTCKAGMCKDLCNYEEMSKACHKAILLDVQEVLNLIQTQQAEIEKSRNTKDLYYENKELRKLLEKKDNKLKDIKNHIKAELKMIDKLYNEVGWAGKEQYDGMKAAYKCVLNIYFENEVETEDK